MNVIPLLGFMRHCTIRFKLCRSKICKNDERDVPDQILLGAQNTSYYDLMALGTWLDTNFAILIQMRRDGGGHPALRIIQS